MPQSDSSSSASATQRISWGVFRLVAKSSAKRLTLQSRDVPLIRWWCAMRASKSSACDARRGMLFSFAPDVDNAKNDKKPTSWIHY